VPLPEVLDSSTTEEDLFLTVRALGLVAVFVIDDIELRSFLL